jgi:hypothetical protein
VNFPGENRNCFLTPRRKERKGSFCIKPKKHYSYYLQLPLATFAALRDICLSPRRKERQNLFSIKAWKTLLFNLFESSSRALRLCVTYFSRQGAKNAKIFQVKALPSPDYRLMQLFFATFAALRDIFLSPRRQERQDLPGKGSTNSRLLLYSILPCALGGFA